VHSFILQDWTTIRGAVSTITQNETEWLDLAPFQDAVFWIDVREASAAAGSPTLYLQTSPTLDDAFFQSMTATGTAMVGSGTPTVVSVFMISATVPLARFVRWQIAGSPTWDATFRIAVAANSPGM